MLSSFDPFFRDFERLTDGVWGRRGVTPSLMPADVYRRAEGFVAEFDLPGVDPATIDVTVEKNVLTVSAERHAGTEEGDQVYLAERPQGRYSRQLHLSDHLDTDHIEARYDLGVLSLRIPVSERAKVRKVEITSGSPAPAVAAGSPELN
ncbi:MAG: Hsp20/alpha crystallin family protein [Acidimicrobiaceae bacterium]|nr:Hsp20/alpha crystallin family protein [Acidimicrobiaceae bacterium]